MKNAFAGVIDAFDTQASTAFVADHIQGSIDTKVHLVEQTVPAIVEAAHATARALSAGGKVLLCGNGGSAADSQHIAGEFVSVLSQRFMRPGLPAIALTTDSSIITAYANDFGFEGVYARQVQALGAENDVLIGISTSGNSPNVLAAIMEANQRGLTTIGLTGDPGGRIAAAAKYAIRVPSTNTQHIQEAHITIGHALVAIVERALFAASMPHDAE